MPLPERVALKFDLYTLACRALLDRLGDLRMATQTDPRLDDARCFQRFDAALERFFLRVDLDDRHQAAQKLGALLHVEADLLRYHNLRVAAIFDAVSETLEHRVGTWSYQRDLEQLHQQGRQLARQFFADSPWPETQRRFQRTCELSVTSGSAPTARRNALLVESLGYRAAPAAYYATYWDDEQARERRDVLLVDFSFEHSVGLYLAYPFLFFHQYMAHAYATDYNNELFNDGWLLHAAAAFIQHDWHHNVERYAWDLAQANIYYDHLYPRLSSLPRRACGFARDFQSWLPDHVQPWFSRITFELAAFQPDATRQCCWPNQVLRQLERAFTSDRGRLLDALKHTAQLRDLLHALPPA